MHHTVPRGKGPVAGVSVVIDPPESRFPNQIVVSLNRSRSRGGSVMEVFDSPAEAVRCASDWLHQLQEEGFRTSYSGFLPADSEYSPNEGR